MKILLAILLSLASTSTYGADYYLLEPSYLSMEYYEIRNNRDEYLSINDAGSTKYGDQFEHWKYGLAVRFNLDIIRYTDYALYLSNRVHMASTQCCVRQVGWEYELGAHLGKHVDLFWYHHSQHILDQERRTGRFPLQNFVGFRLIMIERGRK